MLKIYRGREPVSVSVETLLSIARMLIDAGEQDRFADLCRDKNVEVSVPANLINLAKAYLHAHGLHEDDAEAERIVSCINEEGE